MLNALTIGALALAAVSRKPPLGWSSWYALGGGVNQSAMEQSYERLTSRSVKKGDNRSLFDVGYTFANLDDGWQVIVCICMVCG